MPGEETIGDWTIDRLVRFLQQALEENPPNRFPSITCDTIDIYQKVNVIDQIQFNQVQTTVGGAGAASALPANPSGYIKILDYTGQPFVIPYYKAS